MLMMIPLRGQMLRFVDKDVLKKVQFTAGFQKGVVLCKRHMPCSVPQAALGLVIVYNCPAFDWNHQAVM